MATTVLISTFPPFSSLALDLPPDTPFSALPTHLPAPLRALHAAGLALSLPAGPAPAPAATLADVCGGARLLSVRLAPRVRGGKGGFGSQLRAAGGRMSSQKTSNNDSCRDLNGRRLSTIKEAKQLAAYLEGEPARKQAQVDAQRAKLEALEKKLGISGGAGGSGGNPADPPASAKRRFDDTEYLEQSRDIVDGVKSAVAAGMLKKKKKAKTSPPAPATTKASGSAGPGTASDVQVEVVDKVLTSAATAPVAAVAAAAAAVGA